MKPVIYNTVMGGMDWYLCFGVWSPFQVLLDVCVGILLKQHKTQLTLFVWSEQEEILTGV